MTEELKLQMITWNVKSKGPSEDFRQLLGLDGDVNALHLPQIYAFGWQEIGMGPSNLLLEEPWVGRIRELLGAFDYVKLNHIRLQGIILAVFAKRGLLTKIKDIEVRFTRTGLGGFWGNKGGVSLRMTVSGCSLVIVNCHLAAHDHKLEQRIRDYNCIIDTQQFKDSKARKITTHDYALLMGDLNFRINDLSAPEIHDKIRSGTDEDRRALLEKDQLSIVRASKRALTEMNEGEITFWPTYKFKANTDQYDFKKRKPAFTDRVLYRCTNESLELTQNHYSSHSNYRQSDHKPVSAQFTLKVFPPQAFPSLNIEQPVTVQFLPIRWAPYEDGVVWYRFKDESTGRWLNREQAMAKRSDTDWLALFSANFTSLDDYIVYNWAYVGAIGLSPTPEVAADVRDSASQPLFSSPFLAVLVCGYYRLVYMKGGDDITSVLGISDVFAIGGEYIQG